MRRPTAILIVMLLVGAPHVSMLCEVWCSTPAAEAQHRAVGCHSADEGVPREQAVAAFSGCHHAPAVIAFVNEARQPETRSVEMVSVDGTSPVLANGDVTHEGWSVFNGQSARPPTFRTILRI